MRAHEQAGAAAIQLEDQAFPKRCGHLAGKRLVTPEVFVEAPRSVEEMARIGREVASPKRINIVAGGLTPEVDHALLGELGFAIAIYPTTPCSRRPAPRPRRSPNSAGRPPACRPRR